MFVKKSSRELLSGGDVDSAKWLVRVEPLEFRVQIPSVSRLPCHTHMTRVFNEIFLALDFVSALMWAF